MGRSILTLKGLSKIRGSISFNIMTKFYYTIFNLVALALIIYFGVDSFYRIVTARMDQANKEEIMMYDVRDGRRYEQSRLTDYKVIGSRNVFSKLEKLQVNDDSSKIEELEPTSLKIKLLGTVAGNQQNTAAIIEETSKRTQGIYRIGDSIQEATVKSILRGKVVLRVGDRDEILMMEEPISDDNGEQDIQEEESQRSVRQERTITLRRADIEKSLDNINDLLSQASITAHFTDDQADGLAITGIRAGSIFRRMGLRNGDIIQGVSNNEIKSPDDIISLYNDLRSESDVSLQIKRRGREFTLNYSFRD